MANIERIELLMVDLAPKVRRVDAIQSFVSQETPIVRITDADGATGIGYSYTIGTGGHSVIELLARTLAPALLGRDAAAIEGIWRDLLFLTHATSVGAITSLALAAIDTALWDLRCRKAGLPLHLMAGGARDRVPLIDAREEHSTGGPPRRSMSVRGEKPWPSPGNPDVHPWGKSVAVYGEFRVAHPHPARPATAGADQGDRQCLG